MRSVVAWSSLSVVILTGVILLLRFGPSPASPEALAAAEAHILSGVQAPLEHRTVPVGEYQLHTVIVGDGERPPLVMLHGHGGGLAVFAQNFDALAEAYTVYAVDLLGWGRSSRPEFEGETAATARDWWVDSLEQWRREMGLERFTLLGHSMGGFVAASYALAHPDSVAHLILVDSAGMSREVALQTGIYFNIPPQAVVRWAGPLGPALVRASRGEEAERNPYPTGALMEYYYQLSAAPASGEVAFRKLLGLREWALPLMEEVGQLPMPVTFIWGQDDALVSPENARLAHQRIATSELVLIPDAGHSPHSETPEAFNQAILDSRFRVGDVPTPER